MVLRSGSYGSSGATKVVGGHPGGQERAAAHERLALVLAQNEHALELGSRWRDCPVVPLARRDVGVEATSEAARALAGELPATGRGGKR